MRRRLGSCVSCVSCGWIHAIGRPTIRSSERAPAITPSGDAEAPGGWLPSLTSNGGPSSHAILIFHTPATQHRRVSTLSGAIAALEPARDLVSGSIDSWIETGFGAIAGIC